MSFDLSWLWNLLNSIASTLNTWFATIWTQVINIANTGQGVFAGLVAFGSQLWDGLTKFAVTVGEAFENAYNYLKSGLENFGNVFGQWVNSAFTFLAQGVTWLGSQLYNIGYWLYDTLAYVWQHTVNTVVALWNNLTTWFSGVATSISSWWGSVTTAINTWWTNIITTFRNKMIQSVTASLAITIAWKSAERFFSMSKMSDLGYGMVGILTAPIVGRLVGEIVDAVVPIPSSATYPLIPSLPAFGYTPPTLSVSAPTPPTPPTPTVVGAPAGAFTGLSEKALPISLSVDYSVMAGQDRSLSIGLSYEVSVA